MLVITRRCHVPPRIMAIILNTPSMNSAEDMGLRQRKLDVLEMLQQEQVRGRNRAAGLIARVARHSINEIEAIY